jgi:hypothetical protein
LVKLTNIQKRRAPGSRWSPTGPQCLSRGERTVPDTMLSSGYNRMWLYLSPFSLISDVLERHQQGRNIHFLLIAHYVSPCPYRHFIPTDYHYQKETFLHPSMSRKRQAKWVLSYLVKQGALHHSTPLIGWCGIRLKLAIIPKLCFRISCRAIVSHPPNVDGKSPSSMPLQTSQTSHIIKRRDQTPSPPKTPNKHNHSSNQPSSCLSAQKL